MWKARLSSPRGAISTPETAIAGARAVCDGSTSEGLGEGPRGARFRVPPAPPTRSHAPCALRRQGARCPERPGPASPGASREPAGGCTVVSFGPFGSRSYGILFSLSLSDFGGCFRFLFSLSPVYLSIFFWGGGMSFCPFSAQLISYPPALAMLNSSLSVHSGRRRLFSEEREEFCVAQQGRTWGALASSRAVRAAPPPARGQLPAAAESAPRCERHGVCPGGSSPRSPPGPAGSTAPSLWFR